MVNRPHTRDAKLEALKAMLAAADSSPAPDNKQEHPEYVRIVKAQTDPNPPKEEKRANVQMDAAEDALLPKIHLLLTLRVQPSMIHLVQKMRDQKVLLKDETVEVESEPEVKSSAPDQRSRNDPRVSGTAFNCPRGWLSAKEAQDKLSVKIPGIKVNSLSKDANGYTKGTINFTVPRSEIQQLHQYQLIDDKLLDIKLLRPADRLEDEVCFACGDCGHHAFECETKKAADALGKPVCYRCQGAHEGRSCNKPRRCRRPGCGKPHLTNYCPRFRCTPAEFIALMKEREQKSVSVSLVARDASPAASARAGNASHALSLSYAEAADPANGRLTKLETDLAQTRADLEKLQKTTAKAHSKLADRVAKHDEDIKALVEAADEIDKSVKSIGEQVRKLKQRRSDVASQASESAPSSPELSAASTPTASPKAAQKRLSASLIKSSSAASSPLAAAASPASNGAKQAAAAAAIASSASKARTPQQHGAGSSPSAASAMSSS